MYERTERIRTSLIATVTLLASVGCSSGVDSLGGLTSAVKAHIHMNEGCNYKAVDDSQLMVDLGDIYLTQERRAWFTLKSVGNAPVMIQSMAFVETIGDGWVKPELKITEESSALETPHTLEVRDEYLVQILVAPMVAGTLRAKLEVSIPGVDPVILNVVARAIDGSRAPVVPGAFIADSTPGAIQVPVIEVWPEEPTEVPETDEVAQEPDPVIEEEPEVEVEEEPETGDEGVDVNEQVPVQIEEPEEEPEPELEIDEEPEPEEEEPETLIGGNLLAEDEGEDVIVTCVSKGGGYTHELYLDNTNTFICDSADVGTQVNLGAFPAGTELVFRLDVLNSGYSYYTGSASRNPDSEIHVRIDSTEDGTHLFGFEDLYGGGDRDYDDCVFSVSGSDADWIE